MSKNSNAINICNKRKKDYHVSQSAVKDGNYHDFNNLDNEIKQMIISINAVPVERNRGLDGIYSSVEGFIGIRFQRENESISETIDLKGVNSKTFSKKNCNKKYSEFTEKRCMNTTF